MAFGESILLGYDHNKRFFNAVAVGPVKVLQLERIHFEMIMTTN